MRGAAAFAWLALAASSLAAAQPVPPNPNADAGKLAERLGAERNAEGLRVILESRNTDLIKDYDRGMRHGAVAPKMPADLEALLVRFYDDPVVGGAARVLSTWDHPQTRAYCDKLVAEWKAGAVRPSTYPMRDSALKCEAPGVEAELAQWIASPNPPRAEDFRQVVSFLGRRRSADAVPILAKLDLGPQLDMAPAILGALLEIGTPEAVEAALVRLGEVRRIGGARADEVRRYPLQRLASDPDKVAIGYATFKRYEPEAARASAATWLSKRKDPDAVEDTLALLGATPPRYDAVQALIATDDVAVWKRGRDAVESLHRAGAWDDGHYRFAAGELDRKLADPQAHFAQRDMQHRYAEYQKGMAPIQKARNDSAALRSSDPTAWLEAMRLLVLRQEALARANGFDVRTVYGGVPQDLARQFMVLGDFARFERRRPRDAVAYYESAFGWGLAFGGFAAGDTQQWDLGDAAASLATYRRVAAELRSAAPAGGGDDAMMRIAFGRWLDAQVAWLADRRVFRGEVGEADAAVAALLAMFGGAALQQSGLATPIVPPKGTPAGFARELAAVPPSASAFIATALATQYLTDARAIRAHLERMDPAGYATAVFFELVVHLDPLHEPDGATILPALVQDPSPRQPLRVAAREFLRERGIVDRVPRRPAR